MVHRAVAAVLTVSDGVSDGTRADESGDVAEGILREAGFDVGSRALVPDDRGRIEALLRELAGTHALVVTTGGTGFGPRDVTPEATRAVIEREAPGIGEAIRACSREHTPNWMLSRALAGTRGTTLIVNFPGNPAAIDQTGDALAGPLAHALELLAVGRAGH